MNKHPARGGASLARGAGARKQRRRHQQIHIRVLIHYDSVVAAQL